MSTTLPLFWHLAAVSKDERLSSSEKLVSDLLKQQAALASTSAAALSAEQDQENDLQPPEDPTTTTDEEAGAVERALDARNASEVVYALRRLMRGLASPRENSRLGFAVALTELLMHLTSITAHEALVLVLKYATPQDIVRGQEERDFLFARLFGVQALVQSGVLFASRSRLEDFQRATEVILAVSEKKGWLRESSWWVLVQAVEKIGEQEVPSWKSEALEWLAERICSTKREWTPEKLGLVLKLREQLPSFEWRQHVLPPFKQTQLLATANLPILARVLKDATVQNADEESQQAANASAGSWKQQLHFVWDIILDSYYPPSGVKAKSKVDASADRAPFADLFRVVVDESLFASASSPERKSWGFQVFEKALPRMPADEMPLLFTPNFMRTWINQLASKDRFLHKAALRTATTLQTVVESNPTIGFTLVSQLLGKHGNTQFDKITHTKTVESILTSLDAIGVRNYITYLRSVVLTMDADEEFDFKRVESRRKWAFDQLLTLVRNNAIPKDDECITDVLGFFAVHGFFAIKKVDKNRPETLTVQPKPALSDDLRQLCRSRFLSCLGVLTEQTTTFSDLDGKTRKLQGVTSTGELWVSKAFDIISDLEKDSKHYSSIVEMEEEALKARVDAPKTLGTIRKLPLAVSDASLRDRTRAFELLLLSTLLVSYDDAEEASDLLEPLDECAKRLFSPKAQAAIVSEDGEREPSGVEILVDSLIGLLERSSAFLRNVAGQVFAVFSADMTEESIDHLIDQLGLGEEPAQDMDVDGHTDSAEDDAEVGDVVGDGDEDDASTSETSAQDEEEEEEADEDVEEVDPVLRQKIKEALRVNGMADEQSEEDDDDSDAESDITAADDEQMMQLDDKLAEIFRQQLTGRREDKDARREALTFQNKILDLLDIFARKESSSPLTLRLIRPLFTVVRDSDKTEKQLSTKASTILRNRICKSKDTPEVADSEVLLEDLKEVHLVARNTNLADLSSLCSAVSLYLVKVSVKGSANELLPQAVQAAQIYEESLEDYMSRKASPFKPAFFIDAFRRFPLLAWTLRNKLIASCQPTGSARAYRQVQALQMLQAMISQIPMLSDESKTQELLAFMPEVCDVICDIVSSATSDSDTSLNSNRLKEVLKFALQAVRVTKRVAGSDEQLKKAWSPKKLSESAASLEASDRFKASTSLHGLFKQLLALIEKNDAAPKSQKSKTQSSANGQASEKAMPGKQGKKRPSRDAAQAETSTKPAKKKAKKAAPARSA